MKFYLNSGQMSMESSVRVGLGIASGLSKRGPSTEIIQKFSTDTDYIPVFLNLLFSDMSSSAVVFNLGGDETLGDQRESAHRSIPNNSNVMPLAVIDGCVFPEAEESVRQLLEQRNLHAAAVRLQHDSSLGWHVRGRDAVHGEEDTSLITLGILNPHGGGQTGRGAGAEWNHKGGTTPLRLGKVHVVVNLNS